MVGNAPRCSSALLLQLLESFPLQLMVLPPWNAFRVIYSRVTSGGFGCSSSPLTATTIKSIPSSFTELPRASFELKTWGFHPNSAPQRLLFLPPQLNPPNSCSFELIPWLKRVLSAQDVLLPFAAPHSEAASCVMGYKRAHNRINTFCFRYKREELSSFQPKHPPGLPQMGFQRQNGAKRAQIWCPNVCN